MPYPEHLMTAGEREYLSAFVHRGRCVQGWSFRRVQAELAGQTGVPRSLGMLYRDYRESSCEACPPPPGALVREDGRPGLPGAPGEHEPVTAVTRDHGFRALA